MARLHIGAICGVLLISTPGFAADLDNYPPPVADHQFIQETSGWYLRGDLGASFDTQPQLNLDPNALASTPPPAGIPTSFSGNRMTTNFDTSVGVGYRFNDFFRMDATLDFRTGPNQHGVVGGVVCPYAARGIFAINPVTGAQTPLGVGYNTAETCNGNLTLKQQNYTTLVNGYYDIVTYYGFTPYVGGGIGFNAQTTSGGLNYTESANGSAYRADLTAPAGYPQVWVNPTTGNPVTPQPNIAFAPQNWDRTIRKTHYNFAWALTAGFAYKITHDLSLDLSYRYADLGTMTVALNPQTGATISQRNTAQDVRIGLRFMP
jgi:opacity protein-like surface antigen